MCTLETFKNRVLNLFNLKSGRLTAILTLNPETVKASEKGKQKARTRTWQVTGRKWELRRKEQHWNVAGDNNLMCKISPDTFFESLKQHWLPLDCCVHSLEKRKYEEITIFFSHTTYKYDFSGQPYHESDDDVSSVYMKCLNLRKKRTADRKTQINRYTVV